MLSGLQEHAERFPGRRARSSLDDWWIYGVGYSCRILPLCSNGKQIANGCYGSLKSRTRTPCKQSEEFTIGGQENCYEAEDQFSAVPYSTQPSKSLHANDSGSSITSNGCSEHNGQCTASLYQSDIDWCYDSICWKEVEACASSVYIGTFNADLIQNLTLYGSVSVWVVEAKELQPNCLTLLRSSASASRWNFRGLLQTFHRLNNRLLPILPHEGSTCPVSLAGSWRGEKSASEMIINCIDSKQVDRQIYNWQEDRS